MPGQRPLRTGRAQGQALRQARAAHRARADRVAVAHRAARAARPRTHRGVHSRVRPRARPTARPDPGVSQAAIDRPTQPGERTRGRRPKGGQPGRRPDPSPRSKRPPPAAWEADDWIDEGDIARGQARARWSAARNPQRSKTVARDVEGGAPITNLPGDVVAEFETRRRSSRRAEAAATLRERSSGLRAERFTANGASSSRGSSRCVRPDRRASASSTASRCTGWGVPKGRSRARDLPAVVGLGRHARGARRLLPRLSIDGQRWRSFGPS